MRILRADVAALGRRPLFVVWLLVIAAVAYYSLQSSDSLGDVPGSDKVWHGAGYAILAAPLPFLWANRRSAFRMALLVAGYGVLLEFAQEFVPGRNFEVADMIANAAGVFVGFAIAEWVKGIVRTRGLTIAGD